MRNPISIYLSRSSAEFHICGRTIETKSGQYANIKTIVSGCDFKAPTPLNRKPLTNGDDYDHDCMTDCNSRLDSRIRTVMQNQFGAIAETSGCCEWRMWLQIIYGQGLWHSRAVK